MKKVMGYEIKPQANLYRADLREANLYRANLCGADLYRANLYRANLCGANLCGADLYRADLCGADLYDANLDFSCLPLWCGSFGMIVDDRFVKQILCHFARLDVSKCSPWIRYVHRVISNLYNCKNWFCKERNDVEEI